MLTNNWLLTRNNYYTSVKDLARSPPASPLTPMSVLVWRVSYTYNIVVPILCGQTYYIVFIET